MKPLKQYLQDVADSLIEQELDDNDLLYEQAIEHEIRLEKGKAELHPQDGWEILVTHVRAGMYGKGLERFFKAEGRFPDNYVDLREWLEIDE